MECGIGSFTGAVKIGIYYIAGGLDVGAEDSGMPVLDVLDIFLADEASLGDRVQEKLADDLCDGGSVLGGEDASGTIEAVVDGNGDVWHCGFPPYFPV